MTIRPQKVSEEVWDSIKDNPDLDKIIHLAGQVSLRGLDPDYAIELALIKNEWDQLLLEENFVEILHALSIPFNEFYGDSQPRSKQLIDLIKAMLYIIKYEKEDILNGIDPMKIILHNNIYPYAKNDCIYCGEEIEREDIKSPLPVHQHCLYHMTEVANIFRNLAIEISSR